MGSKFGRAKFNARTDIDSRKQGTREERAVAGGKELLLFSFKDWDQNQCPPGQTFKEWEKAGLLSALTEKLVHLSQKNRIEASQQQIIKVYGSFPPDSDFKVPAFIEGEVAWAVIEDVGGQKHRVAGYIQDNVFYIVFLDKDHKFWKMQNVKG